MTQPGVTGFRGDEREWVALLHRNPLLPDAKHCGWETLSSLIARRPRTSNLNAVKVLPSLSVAPVVAVGRLDQHLVQNRVKPRLSSDRDDAKLPPRWHPTALALHPSQYRVASSITPDLAVGVQFSRVVCLTLFPPAICLSNPFGKPKGTPNLQTKCRAMDDVILTMPHNEVRRDGKERVRAAEILLAYGYGRRSKR
jgi:hypothetical protein